MVHLIYGDDSKRQTEKGQYICPACGGDTSNLGLDDYLCTFEVCECELEGYPHLLEAKWHRKCYDEKVKSSL